MESAELKKKYFELREEVFNLLKKLPKNFSYHNIDHTKDVIRSAKRIALKEGPNKNRKEFWLLMTASVFHDAGYLENYKEHEENGIKHIEKILPSKGYSKEEIKIISGMIRATKLPQSPKNIYEKIICDADLDNLGRKDLFRQGNNLRRELKSLGIEKTDKEWREGQIKLLENHNYFTKSARKMRDKQKENNLEELKRILNKKIK